MILQIQLPPFHDNLYINIHSNASLSRSLLILIHNHVPKCCLNVQVSTAYIYFPTAEYFGLQSMHGIGGVAIDGPRLEPESDVSEASLARDIVFIRRWVAKLG